MVTAPERVLPNGEANRYDPQVTAAGVRDVRRRLNRAVRLRNGQAGPGFVGTSLRDLFGDDPNYEFQEHADDVTVLRPPGFTGTAYSHLNEGVPAILAGGDAFPGRRWRAYDDPPRHTRWLMSILRAFGIEDVSTLGDFPDDVGPMEELWR